MQLLFFFAKFTTDIMREMNTRKGSEVQMTLQSGERIGKEIIIERLCTRLR